jgi:nucleotide-binding universal stress UspA family protein
MKILVAYDASPHAQRAVDEVTRRPWPRDSHLRIVMVLEEPFALEPPYEVEGEGPLIERVRKARRRSAGQLLRKLGRELESKTKMKVSTDLREGSPKKELLEAIEEWKPDLVMVGSHGRKGLSKLFMGSVSLALVTNAPCSVEVVKC